jgi:hypothetical protein
VEIAAFPSPCFLHLFSFALVTFAVLLLVAAAAGVVLLLLLRARKAFCYRSVYPAWFSSFSSNRMFVIYSFPILKLFLFLFLFFLSLSLFFFLVFLRSGTY